MSKIGSLLLHAKRFVANNVSIPDYEKADFRSILFDTNDFHPMAKVDALWSAIEKPTEAKVVKALAGVIWGYVTQARKFYADPMNFAPGYKQVKINTIPAELIKEAATKIYKAVLDKPA